MEVKVTRLTDWDLVKKCALTTVWRGDDAVAYPSVAWRKKILRARHSPIEALMFLVELRDIPYWVSVHLVRHKVGVTHFVSSQRDDRHDNAVPRAEMPQGALVNHTMVINAQAIIAISRKRLCGLASSETHEVWSAVKKQMAKVDVDVASAMLPECVWCGDRCPEMRGCGMCPPVEVW